MKISIIYVYKLRFCCVLILGINGMVFFIKLFKVILNNLYIINKLCMFGKFLLFF